MHSCACAREEAEADSDVDKGGREEVDVATDFSLMLPSIVLAKSVLLLLTTSSDACASADGAPSDVGAVGSCCCCRSLLRKARARWRSREDGSVVREPVWFGLSRTVCSSCGNVVELGMELGMELGVQTLSSLSYMLNAR